MEKVQQDATSEGMPPKADQKTNARTVMEALSTEEKIDRILDATENPSPKKIRGALRSDASKAEKAVYWLEDVIAPPGSTRRGLIKGGAYGFVAYKTVRLGIRGVKAGWHLIRGNPVEAVQEGAGAFQELAD